MFKNSCDTIPTFLKCRFYIVWFCTGEVSGHFGIFTMYPRKMLPTTGSHKICDVKAILIVEEDDSFPDPVTYLDTEVSLYYCSLFMLSWLQFKNRIQYLLMVLQHVML